MNSNPEPASDEQPLSLVRAYNKACDEADWAYRWRVGEINELLADAVRTRDATKARLYQEWQEAERESEVADV